MTTSISKLAWRQLDPSLASMLKFLTPVVVVESLIFFALAGLLVLKTPFI